jgi:hypothetical protein
MRSSWGVAMPRMDWGQFLDAHYRPHQVAVNLGTPSNSKSGRHLIALLERLTESLSTAGNYSIRTEGRVVKVAFERDIDAETFGQALSAQTDERGPEWASQWVCSFDRDAQHEIVATLKETRLQFAKRRGLPLASRARKG